MKKIIKRLFSITLIIVMFINVTPISANATGFFDEIVEGDAAKQTVLNMKSEMTRNEGQDTLNRVPIMSITDAEIEFLYGYDEYLKTHPKASIDDYINSISMSSGVPPVANTKYTIRNSMFLVAVGGTALGYNFAGELLNHSLQDSPPRLTFSRGSTRSNQVMSSSRHTTIIANVSATLRNLSSSVNYWSATGSTTFNTTTDLFLAINKASYLIGAERVGNRWDIYVNYSDTYDFEYSNWYGAGLTGTAAAALNNYGYIAQQIGAVVPYGITILTLNSIY